MVRGKKAEEVKKDTARKDRVTAKQVEKAIKPVQDKKEGNKK